MQAATQTRLSLSETDSRLLDQMAALYGSMKRRLYARIAAGSGKAKSHKTAFSREHGIPARMFNAIAIEPQGFIDGTRELLMAERKSLRNGIRQLEKQLAVRRIRLEALAENRLRMSPLRRQSA